MGIGKIITKRRKELNFTQKELAFKLGVTIRSVSRWEKGASTPDIHSLKKLSKILDITMDSFFNEIEVNEGEDVPIDASLISRFTTLSILSTGFLFMSLIAFLYSYFLEHGSKLSFAFQLISLSIIVISITTFIISTVSFSTKFKTKKLQKVYKRIKFKYFFIYIIIFLLNIISIIAITMIGES